jgi:hypothetical protein
VNSGERRGWSYLPERAEGSSSNTLEYPDREEDFPRSEVVASEDCFVTEELPASDSRIVPDAPRRTGRSTLSSGILFSATGCCTVSCSEDLLRRLGGVVFWLSKVDTSFQIHSAPLFAVIGSGSLSFYREFRGEGFFADSICT